MEKYKSVEEPDDIEEVYIVLKIKDLQSYAPNLKIDWLSFINHHKFNSSFLTEDDEIRLYNPEIFKPLLLALNTIDKRFVS